MALSKNANDTKDNDKNINEKLETYLIERVFFYKEVDGKIVDWTDEIEARGYINYSINISDYDIENNEDNNYEITFNKKNKEYKLIVSLENGKFLTLKDIEDNYKSKFVFIDTDSSYKVKDINVLKVEYKAGENNYLEYLYLHKNGLYIKYSFIGDSDYKFDYKEVEKLLNFDVKDRTL